MCKIKIALKLKFGVSPWPPKLLQLSARVHQPSAKALWLCCHWEWTQGASPGVGVCAGEVHMGPPEGNLWMSYFQWARAGLLMESAMQLVDRSYPFNAFQESYLSLSQSFPVLQCATQDSVLLTGQERNGLLWQHLTQVEKPRCSFKCSHFHPTDRSRGKKFSPPWVMPPWRADAGKVTLFLLPSPMHTHSFFAPGVSWNFSAEKPSFPKRFTH